MKNAFEYEAELAALREELATQERVLRSSVPEQHKGCTSPVGAVQNHIGDLEQRLADAERRNSELAGLLEHAYGCIENSNEWRWLIDRIDVALKPTESGASR